MDLSFTRTVHTHGPFFFRGSAARCTFLCVHVHLSCGASYERAAISWQATVQLDSAGQIGIIIMQMWPAQIYVNKK